MTRVLDMMWRAITATWNALGRWLETLGWNPATWGAFTWFLAALLLLLLFFFLLRPRGTDRTTRAAPDLMVSRGQIIPSTVGGASQFTMCVSNLGSSPLQLLELSVCTDQEPTPVVVEIASLLAANQSVDVLVELPVLTGERGTLELYAFAAEARKRCYRLRSSFVWEPWNGRYKVDPLDQRVEAVRVLASTQQHQQQQEEWRRRQQAEAERERLERERLEHEQAARQVSSREGMAGEPREVEELFDEESAVKGEEPSDDDSLEFPNDF